MNDEIDDIARQLTRIYLDEEDWHDEKLSKPEAIRYHKRLIEKGSIIQCTCGKRLVGYIEVWKVNFEQFGRLVCNTPFSAVEEDVENGNIGWVGNIWVEPEYRHKGVFKAMRKEFIKMCKTCDYYAGRALTKDGKVKLFNRRKHNGR